ncbi:Uncharacterised protein [uncultured archaeon]|nr:Uncharacterised protein [uncultured archaeon]
MDNKSLMALLFLFPAVVFFSENAAAAPPNSGEPQFIYFPDCNTLEELEAFVENDFVIPEGSSCVAPVIVRPETKREPVRYNGIGGMKSSGRANLRLHCQPFFTFLPAVVVCVEVV